MRIDPDIWLVYDCHAVTAELTRLLPELKWSLLWHLLDGTSGGNGSVVDVIDCEPDEAAEVRIRAWMDRPDKSKYVEDRDGGLYLDTVIAYLMHEGSLMEGDLKIHAWW